MLNAKLSNISSSQTSVIDKNSNPLSSPFENPHDDTRVSSNFLNVSKPSNKYLFPLFVVFKHSLSNICLPSDFLSTRAKNFFLWEFEQFPQQRIFYGKFVWFLSQSIVKASSRRRCFVDMGIFIVNIYCVHSERYENFTQSFSWLGSS